MRTALVMAVALVTISAKAAVFFDLMGPAGEGLRGGNERPTPNASTALGGELNENFPATFASINYEPTTMQLFVAFGWGSANSGNGNTWADLESNFAIWHIHGPVPPPNFQEGFASPLPGYAYNAPTFQEPGGVSGQVVQTFTLVTQGAYTAVQQETDLLAGRWYINVHSATLGGGEIRGQLVAVPEPQHYAAFAGLGLLGFAGYRRFKTASAV